MSRLVRLGNFRLMLRDDQSTLAHEIHVIDRLYEA